MPVQLFEGTRIACVDLYTVVYSKEIRQTEFRTSLGILLRPAYKLAIIARNILKYDSTSGLMVRNSPKRGKNPFTFNLKTEPRVNPGLAAFVPQQQ